MKIKIFLSWAIVMFSTLVLSAHAQQYALENNFLSRTITTKDGVLRTTKIVNKWANTQITPIACDEFRLRISQGTHIPGTDVELSSADFRVTDVKEDKDTLVVQLENTKYGLTVSVHYTIQPDQPWMNKRLVISARKNVCLERIDVEAISVADAWQPYTIKQITANAPGNWKPGLGQPLYTKNTGTFWGMEFPAACNFVNEKEVHCGYLWGRELEAGKEYTSHAAVLGVGDDPKFIKDRFLEYISKIRVRPLRLQIQYNSWFDFGGSVSRESFLKSVTKIHEELVEKRGCRPLKNYVIDDGWQDVRADWSDRVWKINKKFGPNFESVTKGVTDCHSKLGLWLSPGCLFGAQNAVPGMRKLGWEALSDWMSMAGPQYMSMLEKRMLELQALGVTYFKLDGVFGHLNQRNFELHGDRYGLPVMPQLELEGFTSSDKRLNDSKYDELKMYYLTAGTERLMEMFAKMAEKDPEVYIVISNGAYLSPWWLQHVDTVWMINAGDAAGGSSRTAELVYRDERYHEIFLRENTQFPMCALFNHEPKKTKSGESADEFRHYLYMNLSRGTGFIELYLKTFNLKEQDWDVLSEGLHWAYKAFPAFERSRMHGGNPGKGEVYGYTGWTENQGYISFHNPSDKPQEYSVTLDRAFGLLPGSKKFTLSSPIDDSVDDLEATYGFGDTLTLKLEPRQIRILDFNAIKQ